MLLVHIHVFVCACVQEVFNEWDSQILGNALGFFRDSLFYLNVDRRMLRLIQLLEFEGFLLADGTLILANLNVLQIHCDVFSVTTLVVHCLVYFHQVFKFFKFKRERREIKDHLSVTMSKTAPKVETEPGREKNKIK